MSAAASAVTMTQTLIPSSSSSSVVEVSTMPTTMSSAGTPPSNSSNSNSNSPLARSSIYKRHEARSAKSYANKEDPRPAAVRVLSLLPGFRMIVPQFENAMAAVSATVPTVAPTQLGDYSEDTVFTTLEQQGVAVASATSNSNNNTFLNSSLVQSMVAAGVAATAAHGLLGGPPTSKPFAFNAPHNPFIGGATLTNEGAITFASIAQQQQHVTTKQPYSIAMRTIAKSVVGTSLVFSARAAATQQQNDTSTILPNLTAGVVAGGWTYLFSNAAASTYSLSTLSTFAKSTSKSIAGKEVIATFLYFQIYDTLKATHDSATPITCAVSGAISGSLTQMMRGYGIRSAITVAPKHALLFATYESLLQAMRMSN